jgi:hypothetical protein
MTTREPTIVDDIYEGEEEDLTAPCASSLKGGETVTDAVVTCVWLSGVVDASPSARISTARQIVGTDVIQRVAGQIAGAWYMVDFLVTLSSGRKLAGQCIFYTKSRGLS